MSTVPDSIEPTTPPPQSPAMRLLLKERAYRELKALIQTGELSPEATLSERMLADRLGMSKTPIRAALEKLESQGLVTVSPQKGIIVRELSAREIAELFDLRAAIEPFIVARLARSCLADAQRDALKTSVDQQRTAADNADPLLATQLDVAFHRLLARILDNREMMVWLERCFDKLHRSILQVNRLGPDRLRKSQQDHEAIANALMEGTPEEASRLMNEHLAFGRRFLLLGETHP